MAICCGISRAIPTCLRIAALLFICAGLAAPHWEFTFKAKEEYAFLGPQPRFKVEVGLFDGCFKLVNVDDDRRLTSHDDDRDDDNTEDDESCDDPLDAIDDSDYPTEYDDEIKGLINGGRAFLIIALGLVSFAVLLSVLILGKTGMGACAVRKCCCLSVVGISESLATLITKLGAILGLAGTGIFGFKFFLEQLGTLSSFYELDEAKLLGGGIVLIFACIFMLLANFLQCCCVKEVSKDDEESKEEAVVESTQVEAALDADTTV